MNETLCKHRDKFNYYNIVNGRFRFDESLTRGELATIAESEGQEALDKLPRQVGRARSGRDLDDILFTNRAGEEGKHLTLDECIEYFLS